MPGIAPALAGKLLGHGRVDDAQADGEVTCVCAPNSEDQGNFAHDRGVKQQIVSMQCVSLRHAFHIWMTCRTFEALWQQAQDTLCRCRSRCMRDRRPLIRQPGSYIYLRVKDKATIRFSAAIL